ncbi:MAG TPA: heme ABC exporter ATP-binding protein CcmA [bacterium]|nr:heme ABC exporter ATP-binding protein CcmA [bacterium]
MSGETGRLELRGVWKSFGGRPVLRDVSLTVDPGRVVALLGPNGAGKSTLLRVAAGVTRADRGEIRLGGGPVSDPGRRRRIGLVGHTSFLYAFLTVAENLRLYARLYGVDARRVEESLTAWGLADHRDRPVRELSRGFTQRVSLARALLPQPALLLLDEPFTGLDAEASAHLRARLAALRADGRAILLATHAWEEAHDLADDAVGLVDGRVARRGRAAALDLASSAADQTV